MGIPPKIGNCSICPKEDTLLYRRNPPMCKACYFTDKINRKKKSVTKPKIKFIAPVSKKKLEDLAKYRPLRDKYLQDNPICEVDDCDNLTTNLHHKAGRNGLLLCDVRYFMACCSECHPKRIHHYPDYEGWAREKGYIITVNTK